MTSSPLPNESKSAPNAATRRGAWSSGMPNSALNTTRGNCRAYWPTRSAWPSRANLSISSAALRCTIARVSPHRLPPPRARRIPHARVAALVRAARDLPDLAERTEQAMTELAATSGCVYESCVDYDSSHDGVPYYAWWVRIPQ
ncbi:hypothetical protein OG948_36020 (plasmid) [Embleya sp. NBC_00888]|uniref:hypothetical protein n=1 Tax=Embleya sp. NBC_00888 TaxID=2975960 RepID=UPI002F916FBF|nr:hypothetical protein OG948_36020 [Embleya sp. NBC_00888]